MTKPSISIAIPVYNQVSTIRDAIESALAATNDFHQCEVVVSENYSNDGTADVVNEYRDLVKIVMPPAHVGPTDNWNFAVNNCSSEWVGMLSGDDLVYPSYIPSMRKAIKKDSTAVFAMGGWNILNVQSGTIEPHRVLSMPFVCKIGRATGNLAFGAKACFAAYCFRKDAFQKLGGFSDNYKLIADWILHFELSMLGASVKTNKIIAQYTVGQDRVDIERNRVQLYCKDLAHFCSSTIWQALDVGVDRALLLQACESHITRAVNFTSHYPDQADEIDRTLLPVYELIGRERVALLARKKPKIKFYLHKFVRGCIESLLPG